MGGYSGVNFGHPKSEVFRNGGGLSGLRFQKGAFWKIWTKIYCAARNLLVHHSSLSHTTYVETNYQQRLLDNVQGSHSTWKETLNMTEYQEKFCDFK